MQSQIDTWGGREEKEEGEEEEEINLRGAQATWMQKVSIMVPFLALDIQSGDTDWGHLLHPELMRQRL
jgi:hypothetical protein